MSPRPLACVLALTSTALAVPLAGLPAGSAAAGAGPGVAAATAHPAAPGRNLQDRPQAPRTAWVWPLDPRPAVSRAFDPPPRRWLAGHRGIDMPAAEGTPVLAPRQGTVTFAGTVVDRGVVTITHPDGLRSSLEPVQPTVT
ncbi:MAG: peptidase M23, partial [Micrococcales bacterium]